MLKLWGIPTSHSASYHPQANGQAERTVQTICRAITTSTSVDALWNAELPSIVQGYNASFHSSIRMTPFEVMHGRKCMVPLSLWHGNVAGTDVVPESAAGPAGSPPSDWLLTGLSRRMEAFGHFRPVTVPDTPAATAEFAASPDPGTPAAVVEDAQSGPVGMPHVEMLPEGPFPVVSDKDADPFGTQAAHFDLTRTAAADNVRRAQDRMVATYARRRASSSAQDETTLEPGCWVSCSRRSARLESCRTQLLGRSRWCAGQGNLRP